MYWLVGLGQLGQVSDHIRGQMVPALTHLTLVAALYVCGYISIHVGPVVALSGSFFGFLEAVLSC